MKIVEITNSARKIIKRLNDLHITYFLNYNKKSHDELSQLIDECLKSSDVDLKTQATIYRNMLINDLVKMLSR
jgi:hypothetical protein